MWAKWSIFIAAVNHNAPCSFSCSDLLSELSSWSVTEAPTQPNAMTNNARHDWQLGSRFSCHILNCKDFRSSKLIVGNQKLYVRWNIPTISLTSDKPTLGNMPYSLLWKDGRPYSSDKNDDSASFNIEGWSRKTDHLKRDSAEERCPDESTALSVGSLVAHRPEWWRESWGTGVIVEPGDVELAWIPFIALTLESIAWILSSASKTWPLATPYVRPSP